MDRDVNSSGWTLQSWIRHQKTTVGPVLDLSILKPLSKNPYMKTCWHQAASSGDLGVDLSSDPALFIHTLSKPDGLITNRSSIKRSRMRRSCPGWADAGADNMAAAVAVVDSDLVSSMFKIGSLHCCRTAPVRDSLWVIKKHWQLNTFGVSKPD